MRFLERYKSDFKANLHLGLPIMAGQLGQIVVNLVDNLMVGRLGATALAAVSLSNAIVIVFMVLGMGLSFALPPLVSQANGSRDERSVSQYFKHSLVANIGFGILSCALILWGLNFLAYLGQEPEVIALSKPFLRYAAYGMIPFMLFLSMRSYCDGLSFTMLPMIAMIAGNVVNIFMNYTLIFGNLGFPQMGVAGAAFASMLARTSMFLILFIIVLNHKRLWPPIKNARYDRYQRKIFSKIFALGIPSSMQGFFEVSAFSGASIIMGMVGSIEQAAHQISINLASMTFLICTGLGMAATIRVGNQLGKRNVENVRSAGFSALIQVTIFMAIAAVLFVLLRSYLPSLYISNQEVIQLAAILLIYAAIFQIPDGVQVTAIGALRGIQDVKIPTLITFIAYWIVGLPISYFTTLHTPLGPQGVWLGLILGLSVSATLLTIRFNNRTENIQLAR